MSHSSRIGTSWQGTLADMANIVYQIRRMRAFGRLTARNSGLLSIIHFYFRAGKLTHIAGNRGNIYAILNELQEWSDAVVHFDRGITTTDVTLNDSHEQLLTDALSRLLERGKVALPQTPRVVEGELVATPEAKQLITPGEWRILIEGTRRVSLAVAQLVGTREALRVLRDIIDDCSSSFPAFASLHIDQAGCLQVVDRSYLDQMPREDLLEGFSTVITTCQHFCSPIVGKKAAHELMIRALHDITPLLSTLGVFHIDNKLLSGAPL